MKTWHYLVGDIHGCLSSYLALEARIFNHAKKHRVAPRIVSVGDLIDRGPDSAGVLEHFYQGFHQGTHLALMGNHEAIMLAALYTFAQDNFGPQQTWPLWLETIQEAHQGGAGMGGMARYLDWADYSVLTRALWIGQGGYQTLESFGMNPHQPKTWRFSALTLDFLLHLPFYYETETFVVTHALASAADLSLLRQASTKQYTLDLEGLKAIKQAVHHVLWNRDLPKERPDPQRLHISGHTPLPRLKKNRRLNYLQIDTGAVYGGRLSAYCPEAKQSLSVAGEKWV